jgi:hypothetical protein
MKPITYALVFLILLGFSAQSQDTYNVTRVNGKVTNLKTGKPIKPGDALQSTDQVKFENFEAYVISIDQKMGRYVLKLPTPQVQTNQKPELTAKVKDIALVTKRRSLMSARFNPEEKEVADLKNYFGADKFTIIGNNVEVALNAAKYPLSENKFIVFNYKVNNNPINKKIAFDQQTLKIEKEGILTTKSGPVSGNEVPELSVHLYDKTTRSSEEITKLTLVFVDQDALRNEFITILPILKRQKMSDEDIKKYLIEYYYDFYGATDSKTIDNFAADVVKQPAK